MRAERMNVLILGSGAREHALARGRRAVAVASTGFLSRRAIPGCEALATLLALAHRPIPRA